MTSRGPDSRLAREEGLHHGRIDPSHRIIVKVKAGGNPSLEADRSHVATARRAIAMGAPRPGQGPSRAEDPSHRETARGLSAEKIGETGKQLRGKVRKGAIVATGRKIA